MPKESKSKDKSKNAMRDIYLDKVVVNIGIGSTETQLQNARMLIDKLTGRTAVATKSKRRMPEFKIRKGQVIGAAVTLRKKAADEMLRRALEAHDNALKPTAIAKNSVNFGIKEYIEFTGVKYDPKIGMLGLNVNAAFARRGNRVAQRKRRRGVVKSEHRDIGSEELTEYLSKNYNVQVARE